MSLENELDNLGKERFLLKHLKGKVVSDDYFQEKSIFNKRHLPKIVA